MFIFWYLVFAIAVSAWFAMPVLLFIYPLDLLLIYYILKREKRIIGKKALLLLIFAVANGVHEPVFILLMLLNFYNYYATREDY